MKIETVDSFDEWIDRAVKATDNRMMSYRGLSDASFEINSTLDRALAGLPVAIDRINAEELMLDTFRHYAKGMTDPLPREAYWMIGRHNGLQTLLMDWTHKLGVATFFAYAQPGEQDRAVIEFDPGSMLDAGYLTGWNDEVGLTARLVAQAGFCFRLLKHTSLEAAYSAFVMECDRDGRKMDASLTKFVLPRKHRAKALRFLDAFNIRYSTLYPDLVGAALAANTHRTDPDFFQTDPS